MHRSLCAKGGSGRGARGQSARGRLTSDNAGQKCAFLSTSPTKRHTMNAALLRRINLQECLQEDAASAGTPRGDPPDGSEAW